jgi:hypothetical protein
MSHSPGASVLMRYQNDFSALCRTLKALALQTGVAESFEVITSVKELIPDQELPDLPYLLRQVVCTEVAQGPIGRAALAAARAPLLIFLAMGSEPAPGWLAAHCAAQAGHPDHAVIGPRLPVLRGRPDLLRINHRIKATDRFTAMAHAGHRFAFHDLEAGNCSFTVALLERCGGLDPDAGCRAFHALGARMLELGVGFVYAPAATAPYVATTTLSEAAAEAYAEGGADVWLACRQPALIPALALAQAWPERGRGRRLRELAFVSPQLGARAAVQLHKLANLAAALRLRGLWRALVDDGLAYWYWRGVAEKVGRRAQLTTLLHQPVASAAPLILDLAAGLSAAEQRLDAERPTNAELRWGRHLLATIPAAPGYERLRGRHLRPFLVAQLAGPQLCSLLVEQAAAEEQDLAWLRQIAAQEVAYHC